MLSTLGLLTRRLLIALAALMLVSAPNLMMTVNASILAHDKSASADPTMLMDDTPDFGAVADPPPTLIGAVNIVFLGLVPDEALRLAACAVAGKSTWALSPCAPLGSRVPETPTGPPRA